MAFITASDFVKWDGTLFTNSDWDYNWDQICSLTSAGSRDSAWSKVGIGTTTLTYPMNIQEGSLGRGINVAITSANSTTYGQYIDITGASSTNIGLFISASGGTSGNQGLQISTEATGALTKGVYSYVYGSITASNAIHALNSATGALNTGIQAQANGSTSGVNRALFAQALGASTNYQLYCSNGTTTAMSLVKLPYLASANNGNAPTGTPDNGSICVGHVSGEACLFAYLSGAWKKVTLS